jgi:transposase
MGRKDYTQLAQDMANLQSLRSDVDRYVALLNAARTNRDKVIRDAINHGMTWREVSEIAGISSPQVGQILKKPTTTSEDASSPEESRPRRARRSNGQRAVG